MTCAICGTRKPKRYCPGVRAEICAICCGVEREETVDCPLDCEYLRQAHDHERMLEVDYSTLPNADIKVTEEFVKENQAGIAMLASAVLSGALESGNPTDYDVREALDALIKTYKTLESGLIYESHPANPYAAAIFLAVQNCVDDVRKFEAEQRGGAFKLRDSTILGVLVFLQRLEYTHNNGRKRSRAFLDVIRQFYEDSMRQAENVPEPDAPRIIV